MNKKERIRAFFIDDNEMDALVFKKLVEKIISPREYELIISRSYDDGLKHLCSNRYDIYFVDFRLDKGTGLDFIHKAIDRGSKGPFVIITNYDDIALYDQGAEHGIYEYLIKSELTPSMIDRVTVYAKARQSYEYKLSYEKKCFQEVISSLPYAVLRVDKTFMITEMNNHIPRILGWKKGDLEKKNIFDYILADNKDEIIDSFFHLKDPSLSFRSLWQTKLGEKRTIYWDCIYRNFSHSNGFLFIAKDMTKDLTLAEDGPGVEQDEAEKLCHSLDEAAGNFGI